MNYEDVFGYMEKTGFEKCKCRLYPIFKDLTLKNNKPPTEALFIVIGKTKYTKDDYKIQKTKYKWNGSGNRRRKVYGEYTRIRYKSARVHKFHRQMIKSLEYTNNLMQNK